MQVTLDVRAEFPDLPIKIKHFLQIHTECARELKCPCLYLRREALPVASVAYSRCAEEPTYLLLPPQQYVNTGRQ